ncbi:MAG: hypothetical protein M0P91_05315 [Sulfuricurvum sp.]|jgi:hypothetical protein|uniref:hypothetical protein n=1 Tax=Sulfuricurvum sp. TaxID=2025608 RepID=UPI0025CCDF48|nr:hypothetical protein [Sulfuricurvum sp.]MCK9372595.1 hypothetical protein [Sulfuricurvum sp.]
MRTFERVFSIVEQKRNQFKDALHMERMICEANIKALREARAEIEAKMKRL